jgi:SPP1 family predicted phage head-tail adaptor
MNAGRMRHRITIQQRANTPDTFGQPIESWADVATVWASVEPLQGREFFAADQVNAEVTTRIRMRWRSGITAAMRVSFDSRLYDIQSVIVSREIHDEMQLMCTEGVNDGG